MREVKKREERMGEGGMRQKVRRKKERERKKGEKVRRTTDRESENKESDREWNQCLAASRGKKLTRHVMFPLMITTLPREISPRYGVACVGVCV